MNPEHKGIHYVVSEAQVEPYLFRLLILKNKKKKKRKKQNH